MLIIKIRKLRSSSVLIMKNQSNNKVLMIKIRKLGSSSVLLVLIIRIFSTDEDSSLRIESSAIINLRGVSTKLIKYIVFTMQTYKKRIKLMLHSPCKLSQIELILY